MRLELHKLPVENLCWGERTHMKDRTLVINREEALNVVKDDPRFVSVSLELARPGESVRIIPVKDAVEPRCKIEGPGEIFPGVIGHNTQTVGEGKTLVLEGAAVLTCGSIVAFQEGFVDMSGPGAAYTPFSETQNVVLLAEPREGLDQHDYEAALREAGLKLAFHLAQECKDTPAEKIEVFDLPSVEQVRKEHPELPGIVYIFMCISQGLLHDTYLYGVDVKQTLPALVHPNEIMDGALIS
ncbi:MAG TPA: glycine/sarcosine/betaine reductase component B subunit, partial [Synergistaceae bacterium]|nr:glycine/sarcosine/betaine reductase component B subunit [Synergistaceae bacterium]